jgi:hypothetical protein
LIKYIISSKFLYKSLKNILRLNIKEDGYYRYDIFQRFKKIGVNTTVLATSVALVACGGGGGGYYGNTNSNTNTGNPSNPSTTKEVAGVSIQLSKGTLKVQGDELIVTAKALDKDSGGVAGAKINLNIKDGEKMELRVMLLQKRQVMMEQ